MLNSLKKLMTAKWELFHSTPSVDQHFEMLEKLRVMGIDYKTKGLNFGGGYGGGSGFSTIYHIYTRQQLPYFYHYSFKRLLSKDKNYACKQKVQLKKT